MDSGAVAAEQNLGTLGGHLKVTSYGEGMEALDTREWLLTNGLGSFASGTVCDLHTRTYHGWFIAAIDPPSQRTMLLSHIEASLYTEGQAVDLGTNRWSSGDIHPKGYQNLHSFRSRPVPCWTWGGETWSLTREILLPYGLAHDVAIDDVSLTTPFSDSHPKEKSTEAAVSVPTFTNCVLIRYTYGGRSPAILTLRPLIGDRSFHQQQQMDASLQFSQLVSSQGVFLQAIQHSWVGTPWHLGWSQGRYYPDGVWYWDFQYIEETNRGLGDREDLYSPGYLVVSLDPGSTVTIEATVGWPDSVALGIDTTTFDKALIHHHQRLRRLFPPSVLEFNSFPSRAGSPSLEDQTFDPQTLEANPFESQSSRHASQADLKQRLLIASDAFIVYRQSVQGPTMIAGYPWFGDWGRDTLISIPGLALATRRFALARGLLQTFASHCEYGLIPNAFPDAGTQPFYNSLDASLWWIETLGLYLEATHDWDFLIEQFPTVQRIYKALTVGTLHNIRVDAVDGLLTWNSPGVALTWMDAVIDEQPVTPRRGKAIEINALWYSALCWAKQWAEWLCQNTDDRTDTLLNQARRYERQAEQVRESLHKFWNSQRGFFFDVIGPNDDPDASIRPNAVIALSLTHCGFSPEHGQRALLIARDRLLTPYGLRTLDPANPAYVGHYAGDVYHRDRAYHQGTVWSWLMGPFVRAWQRFYPDEPIPFDGHLLLDHFQKQACFESISEMFDGDEPHQPQGAIAQAWSVAELIRHFSDVMT